MNANGVQCPKCRAISYPGLMGFPRCHRCHEQLRQCRYCVNQSAGLCQLSPHRRPPLQEEEGKPFCEAFESRLVSRPAAGRLGLALGAETRVLGLLGLLVVVLVWALIGLLGDEYEGVRLEAEAPRVYVDDGRAVANFYAYGDQAVLADLAVLLPPEVAARFIVESPPVATQAEAGPLLPLTPAGHDRARLRLVLVRRPGTKPTEPLVVLLAGPGGEELDRAGTLVVTPK
ncbi:MAG: hypothetical protein HUU35_07025 [Armatimonadetes bacterium]|nr:hypothetical protein [Armatimonadota bacterium]